MSRAAFPGLARASDRRPHLLIADGGLSGLRVRQACRELELDCLSVPVPGEEAGTLVRRAREAGCTHLHPGETGAPRQRDLAEACRREGLSFVGPRAALLAAICDPEATRQLMREAGLPLHVGDPSVREREVAVAVLADAGRVLSLPPRHSPRPGLALAPVPWLTPEQRAYLGRLAVQGVTSLELSGLLTLRFRVTGNRVAFHAITPGLAGDEALGEALVGLDPVVEQIRIALGERLRERQDGLAARGHARLWQLFLDPATGFSGGAGVRLDRCPEAPGEGRLVAWGRQSAQRARREKRALVELLGPARAQALLEAATSEGA